MNADLLSSFEDLADLPYVKSVPILRNPISRLVDSLIHLRIAGDPLPFPFALGRTLRGFGSLDRFRFKHQERQRLGEENTVVTTHESEEGLRLEHRLSWRDGEAVVRVESTFCNGSASPVGLEMLSSFAVSNITPFDPADAPGRLVVHRFRSGWSAEGRLETRSIEELHLERSWTNSGIFCERFGQVGSAPVRGWFPFVAIEDKEAGVTWAAQLAWAGSWQMEIYRRFDDVCLSGGLTDLEPRQWELVCQALHYYRQASPMIKDGISRRHGDVGKSWRYPTGWQGIVRLARDSRFALVVVHAFDSAPKQVTLPLPEGEWAIEWEWPNAQSAIQDRKLMPSLAGPFSATVISLRGAGG